MPWDSPSFPDVICTLSEAQNALTTHVLPLSSEQIAVTSALCRVIAEPVAASLQKPLYDQSTRDGFALSAVWESATSNNVVFRIVREIAAGCSHSGILHPGEAARIMTGGMVPEGAVRVVPFEICDERGSRVSIDPLSLNGQQTFIQPAGSEIKLGKLLVAPGTELLPEHLLMLAENGETEVAVSRQARVGVVCTGSELVNMAEKPGAGQKISGNSMLLPALITTENGRCDWSVTVPDELTLIVRKIREILEQKPDMIITTGGMGPGKFDLMEQVFAEIGGQVIYNQLAVRPGKFTLLGIIDEIPFFALPGPPPAVRLLFHELVAPALRVMQGKKNVISPLVTATLANTLGLKKTGHLSLKGAVAYLSDSGLQVYPAGKMEPVNAIIHLDGKRLAAGYGEEVQVRLLGGLQGLAV
jgi:molybdopterin molybdotransferase